MAKPTNQPYYSELHPSLISTTALISFPGNISSPRLQMFNSQMTQALYTKGNGPRRCFTGMEPKYGKYTFGIRFEEDSRILDVIYRYPKTMGYNSINVNPEVTVIYEYDKHLENGRTVKEIGVKVCHTHHSLHQHFGYKLKYRMDPFPERVAAGTVIAESPAVGDDGNYHYGIETEVALMSIPQVIEDGVVASEEFCELTTTLGMETFDVSWGKHKFPLNLYGDHDDYKIFPDIGECVGPDGILMALRKYDDDTAPVLMSRGALRKPDYKYDQCVYVEPNAKVIDIKVYHDERIHHIRGQSMNTPVTMCAQVQKYLNANKTYYRNILNVYSSLRRDLREAPRISPEFHNLLVRAQASDPTGEKQRIVRTWRGVPIDEWRVEITIEYPVKPTIGYKISGTSGDKGIIVDVRPTEEMPVDANGNRAHLIMDGVSTIKRMNPSRLYEQYFNAAARDLSQSLRNQKNSGVKDDVLLTQLQRFYELINPKMIEVIGNDGKLPLSHLQCVLDDGIYLWIPPNNEIKPLDAVRDIQKEFPPLLQPVTYKGMSGNYVTTNKPVLIGSMYIMVLEKTGRTWAGVSSSKLSHFGVPAKLTNADKNSAPGRNQPIRFGESEDRSFIATVGGEATAELNDRTNNPVKRKIIQETILRADKPTDIPSVVDRRQYPSGQGRIHALIRHIGECYGWRFNNKGK